MEEELCVPQKMLAASMPQELRNTRNAPLRRVSVVEISVGCFLIAIDMLLSPSRAIWGYVRTPFLPLGSVVIEARATCRQGREQLS